ncbi:MAG TPA: cytochrome P450 [Jiangellaceae bacterium]
MARTHPGRGRRGRQLFVQEVRRHYPFTPLVGARVRRDFEWTGRRFPAGTLTLLDVYGTLHDHRLWERPYEFRPDRFKAPYDATYALIPQGGGDAETSHRCAGETITLEIMRRAAKMLCRGMNYRVPLQDPTIDHSRVPTFPASGFVISSVVPRDVTY